MSSENKNFQINNKVNKIITFLFIIILLLFFLFFHQSWNALLVYISYIPFFVWLGGGVVLEVLKKTNPNHNSTVFYYMQKFTALYFLLPVLRRTSRTVIILRICIVSRPFLIFGGSLQIIIAMEKRTIIWLWTLIGDSRVLWIFPRPFTMAILMSGTMLRSRNSHWNHVHSLIYINRGEKLLHATWTYFQVTSWY